MRQLKIAVIALITLVTINNVSAQDENNQWVIGFGVNAVDFYNGDDFYGMTSRDILSSGDWNVLPSITRISVEKYLDKGFTLQLAGSINKIDDYASFVTPAPSVDYLYWAIDANAKYDLNNAFGDTGWFDPYVYVGGGYTSVDSNGEALLNGGIGFNTWFNDTIGLNFQGGFKESFGNAVKSHFQYSVGLAIKFGGKDTDGDGVFDKNDACPEVAGLVEFNGCPDADGDGVKDSDDACPNLAGLAAMNGCPDSDGDGIADKDDACPNVKGTKANKGCPDSDGDGVVDKDDKCPKVAGPASNNGCPELDSDKDGVLDKDDKCPKVAGVASNNGCPAVTITTEAKEAIKFAAKSILFNSAKSSFKPGVVGTLNEVVSIMKKFPKATFAIEGHTDSDGRPASNLKLSNSRANAVMNYFVSNGVSSSRLTAKGFGEDYPIDSNKTRAGKANNRRVVIKVTN